MEKISCGSVCDRFPPLTARYPWLISQNLEDNNQDQYFYTLHDELPHYQCRIPELRGKLIQAPPDDPSSILLLSRTNKSTFVFCRLDLYALREDGKVIVFSNLGKPNYSYKVVVAEAPESVCGSLAQRFLTNSEQHLLLVCMSEYGKHVQVFILNEVKQEWEKITGIGKHMIYICDTTCLCLEAKTPQMENKIIFPRVYTENRKIVFYSLETCMYHTFDGKDIQQVDLFGTTSYLSSHAWIEPSWYR
nr:hypothetical protein CTI12_AA299450 [Tanacetum cinerariifolium]